MGWDVYCVAFKGVMYIEVVVLIVIFLFPISHSLFPFNTHPSTHFPFHPLTSSSLPLSPSLSLLSPSTLTHPPSPAPDKAIRRAAWSTSPRSLQRRIYENAARCLAGLHAGAQQRWERRLVQAVTDQHSVYYDAERLGRDERLKDRQLRERREGQGLALCLEARIVTLA